MELPHTCWTFWRVTVIIVYFQSEMFLGTAAASLPPLTCEVTRTPAGILYRLSRPIRSSQCDTCWEDRNRKVIARGANFNRTLATNLTDQSITMKGCWGYLHFTKDNLGCSGVREEAHCAVNCSLLLDAPLSSVNSTNRFCFSDSWCPDLLVVGLVFGGVAALFAFIFLALYVWRCCKHRRDSAAMGAAYTRADQQIQMDRGDVQHKEIL